MLQKAGSPLMATGVLDPIMSVVTRVAPFSTRYLHIGGARTALFSWPRLGWSHGDDETGQAIDMTKLTNQNEGDNARLLELAVALTEGRRRLLAGMTGLKDCAKTLVELLGVRSVSSADWTKSALEEAARVFAEGRGQKLGKVAQPLRAALRNAPRISLGEGKFHQIAPGR
jgi:hypothetical protein